MCAKCLFFKAKETPDVCQVYDGDSGRPGRDYESNHWRC